MNYLKVTGIITLILWLSVISMAYVNVWGFCPVTTTETEEIYRDSNFDGWYERDIVQRNVTVDAFPHSQLYDTIWITIFFAGMVTAMFLACIWVNDGEEEATEVEISSIHKEQSKEGKTE